MSRHSRLIFPTLTEAQFTNQVLEYAKLRGWRSAHFRPAHTTKGWRTAVQGDGKGFPDLVLVRERIVWAELKVGNNRLSPQQRAWVNALVAAGEEVYVWKPNDWAEIEEVLSEVVDAERHAGADSNPAGDQL